MALIAVRERETKILMCIFSVRFLVCHASYITLSSLAGLFFFFFSFSLVIRGRIRRDRAAISQITEAKQARHPKPHETT